MPHSPGAVYPESILEVLELRKKYATLAEELGNRIRDAIQPEWALAKEEADGLQWEAQVSLHQV